MALGEEKWLFFHGVVVSDLSTGSARIELKFGCYCHVPLKFFSSLLPTRTIQSLQGFCFICKVIFAPLTNEKC